VVCDARASVRLVVDVAAGAVAQRLDYDEFGRVTLDTNPGFQPFGFAGGLYDPATGLVHFGARDYDPQTARWTAPDPAGFGGGLNLYGYCVADPINLADPAGLGPDFASGGYDGYIGWSCGFFGVMSFGFIKNDVDTAIFGQNFGSWCGIMERTTSLPHWGGFESTP
jgi:RHS repeat-associated protein